LLGEVLLPSHPSFISLFISVCFEFEFDLDHFPPTYTSNDGDHHERPKDHQAQPKEDPIKLQEVKEVAKLCRKVLFLPEELVPDSSLRKVIFVTTFGRAQVDPQLEAPYALEA